MQRQYLNEGWQFIDNFREEYIRTAFHESDESTDLYQTIRIPHTVKEVPFHYFDEEEYQMVSTYRRMLYIPKEWEKKSIILTFEGAAHKAEVYVNGQRAAEHACGYTAFSIELSGFVEYGKENLLVVKLDSRESLNIPPFGFVIDYMTFGGIYRDVYLEIGEQTHISDIFVRTQLLGNDHAKLRVDLTLYENLKLINSYKGAGISIYLQPDRTGGAREHLKDLSLEDCNIEDTLKEEFEVHQIRLWDVEHPNLYWLIAELRDQQGNVLDTCKVRFGFREVQFKADGFYLNHRKIKMRGLNRHQSYPYVGYAMPKSMQEFDAEILKYELGCNAVRTSHYPQSQHFLNRCDEIGLLVFTEIPGWQYIGDESWKEQAIRNVEEMVLQYRNHPSIFIWGVRINESKDDEAFYRRTNEVAHRLDDSRPTGGVRAHGNSQLLEDVYTYNDFVHNGSSKGCEPKKKITSDMAKGYLVTEYNGHMYPTKTFDAEEHRVEHALRHVRVLDAVASHEDIAGSFGWCMFDYNTHKDFGSGDRICYHGVMDMFRNPKLAAAVYASQQDQNVILEPASSMDIGEHPACNRGETYIFTNADAVRMYKNDIFIKEYDKRNPIWKHIKTSPMIIDDYIGDQMYEKESFTKRQADIIRESLNYTARNGYGKYPLRIILHALECMIRYRMKPGDAVTLYNKYIGDWGGSATSYRFEAIKGGKVVKTVVKEPVQSIHLEAVASKRTLEEENSYDVSAIRIKAVDQVGNVLPLCQEALEYTVTGPFEIIGPKVATLRGGMAGTYIRTTGDTGEGVLTIRGQRLGTLEMKFEVERRRSCKINQEPYLAT